MDAKTVMDKVDDIKDKMTAKKLIAYNKLDEFVDYAEEYGENLKNLFLIAVVASTIMFSNNYMLWFAVILVVTLIYLLPVVKQYIEFKQTKATLDSIDLTLIGRTLEKEDTLNRRSAYDLLEEYVTSCFEREVLIFHNFKKDDIINSQMEDELLRELVDATVENMSPLVRRKLEIYFGDGQVEIIMSKICFITVSLFAANSKKELLRSAKSMNT